MILQLLIGAAIVCALTAIVCFIQYVRYRMKEDEQKEERYKNIHYTALFLLFAIGVIIMLYMGQYSD